MKNQNGPLKKSILPWLSPAGAFIILICFFLPWLEVKCSGKKILGTGFTFANEATPLWLIPIIALLVMLLYILYRNGLSLNWYRIGNLIAAGLGIVMMVLTYISIEQKLSGFFIKRITSYQIKFGLPGTLIGLLLIFVSPLLLKNKRN